MLSKRRFMINTEMLDRLMKPLIEGDVKMAAQLKESAIISEAAERLEEAQGSNKINKENGLTHEDRLLLKKHWGDNFNKNISYAIRRRNYSMVHYWLNVIDATLLLYRTKFGYEESRYTTSTITMTAALSVLGNHKFIKDAYNRRRDHEADFENLLQLKTTLSSFVGSNGIYDTDDNRRTDRVVKADSDYINMDWKRGEEQYWDTQLKNPKTDEELMTGVFMNINKTIRDCLDNGDVRGIKAQINHLVKCRDIMVRMTESSVRTVNGLYRLIFEANESSESIKQEILTSGLLDGEWPIRFQRATNKQQVINDINRLMRLLTDWVSQRNVEPHEIPKGSEQPQQTPPQPQQPQQPQSNKIKRIDSEWRAFTYNKRLAKDYGLDFKRFALTRGTFSADGKDPGLMNGYEGPKKSGTLRSISFTPADYDTWVAAKEQGNGVRSITDEIKNPAKGYDKKQIADIWKKTTGKEINIA